VHSLEVRVERTRRLERVVEFDVRLPGIAAQGERVDAHNCLARRGAGSAVPNTNIYPFRPRHFIRVLGFVL
jgi:hypothetical protein